MKTFLEKLDRQAGRLLNILDNQMNQPIVDSLNMTSGIFKERAVSEQESIVEQITAPAATPTHSTKPANSVVKRTTVLQKANAK